MANPKQYANPQLLVSPEDLSREMAENPHILLLDTRPAEAFAAGHLPGAAHLDVFGLSLVDTDPAPRGVSLDDRGTGVARVSEDRPVVVYRTAPASVRPGCSGFSAVWPSSRLLDGGFQSWVKAGLPVTAEASSQASEWTGSRDALRTGWREMQERLRCGDATILVLAAIRNRSAGAGRSRRCVRARCTSVDPQSRRGRRFQAGRGRALYEHGGVTPTESRHILPGGYRAAPATWRCGCRIPAVLSYVGRGEWGDRLDLPIEQPTKPWPSAETNVSRHGRDRRPLHQRAT